VRDQVSYPYSTTGKITVLYILIFRFFICETDNRFPKQLPDYRLVGIQRYEQPLKALLDVCGTGVAQSVE